MIDTLRIYCELIGVERLYGEAMLRFMGGFRAALAQQGWSGSVELVLKVLLPADGDVVAPALVERLAPSVRGELEVDRLWLWGQLVDRQRVYLNVGTVTPIFAGWRRLMRQLERAGVAVEGAFFDLEPDREVLEVLSDSWVRGARELVGGARLTSHRRAASRMAAEVEELRADLGAPVLAACAPVTVLGPWVPWGERLIGTPLVCEERGPIFPELTCMNYTSFGLPRLGGVEAARAWSRAARAGGWVARRHVEWTRSLGIVGSVICGTNCVGILGDEPSFPHAAAMRELLHRTAEARPNALEVFNLTGIVYGPQGVDADFAVNEPRWRAWAGVLAEALRR